MNPVAPTSACRNKAIASPALSEVHFGGPDLARGSLRDILAEHIAAVPRGGSIDWVTYYFRDRRLAEDLLRARRRGVRVSVTVEGSPRTVHANHAVAAMLAGPEALGDGFRRVYLPRMPLRTGLFRNPRLHEKIYCFSHPRPIAFVGSFNPSGDFPEKEPGILDEIGDQDSGHNVLVGLVDPVLVDGLAEHARWTHGARQRDWHFLQRSSNRPLRGADTDVYFLPGPHPRVMIDFLDRFGAGDRIRIAASHIKGPALVRTVRRLARHGAALEILANSTPRRVSPKNEERLHRAGIPFRRVAHPDGVPMHNKFVLAENGRERWVMFGSFNWTRRSLRLNRETCVISSAAHLFDAFAERWEAIETLATRAGTAPASPPPAVLPSGRRPRTRAG